VGYLVALLVVLVLVAAGYFVGARRGRSREEGLKARLDERTEKLTLIEHELLRRSSMDPVTELPGQQYFQEFLEREWRRASRDRAAVSVIMIDIDHFRAYNERLGQPDADACLKAVAAALKPIVHRPGDVLARYGGEGRFGVVLGGTEGKGAMILAERMRMAVEGLQRPNAVSPNGPSVTISLGVGAVLPERDAAWQDIELIAMAERALAHATETGRNCVVLDQRAADAASG
jgi:diguanylate cyclase (GGDEF)-like protein